MFHWVRPPSASRREKAVWQVDDVLPLLRGMASAVSKIRGNTSRLDTLHEGSTGPWLLRGD